MRKGQGFTTRKHENIVSGCQFFLNLAGQFTEHPLGTVPDDRSTEAFPNDDSDSGSRARRSTGDEIEKRSLPAAPDPLRPVDNSGHSQEE
jgi:hypothetical protein